MALGTAFKLGSQNPLGGRRCLLKADGRGLGGALRHGWNH